jgi:hypothetical protein
MWVWYNATLVFIEVKAAAIMHYGYSREEFLEMRVTDIPPPEELPRLMNALSSERPLLQHAG